MRMLLSFERAALNAISRVQAKSLTCRRALLSKSTSISRRRTTNLWLDARARVITRQSEPRFLAEVEASLDMATCTKGHVISGSQGERLLAIIAPLAFAASHPEWSGVPRLRQRRDAGRLCVLQRLPDQRVNCRSLLRPTGRTMPYAAFASGWTVIETSGPSPRRLCCPMNTRNAPPQDEVDTRLYVALVERTMRVMAAFDGGLGSRTIADIAKQIDLGRSAVQRIVYTLEQLGYLEREEDQRHYRLTLKILDLSGGLTRPGNLMRLVQPVLQDLADETGETASWVKLEGDEIVIQQTVRSRHLGHVSFAPGQRFAALPSSSGQAILAQGDPKFAESLLAAASPALRKRIAFADAAEMAARFAEIRSQGFATTSKEEDLFSVSISAPVLSSSGLVLGALNVSALESRVPHTAISERLGPPIRAAVVRVARILEHQAETGLNGL
ncbi:hypothetical protein CDO87_23340 (plasmid) [Sagittula sp. P11]|nr:hypothetical protein CDO87_23340 [Sagittula sp. P11]